VYRDSGTFEIRSHPSRTSLRESSPRRWSCQNALNACGRIVPGASSSVHPSSKGGTQGAGLFVLVFRYVELDCDAGVQDQLAGAFSLAQVLESRSARTISVESEKVRPEAASLSENSRARLAHFLGSPLALREGLSLVFFSVIVCLLALQLTILQATDVFTPCA
jgi:hypothetical protein